MDNEEALAPTYVVIILGVIFLGGLLWLAMAQFTNELTAEVVQPLADSGELSMQTRNGYAFGIGMLTYWPVLVLIVLILFAVTVGIYKRDSPQG